MPPVDSNQNPDAHAAAAGVYGTNVQKNTPDQRELEGHVLLKSAKFMQDMQDDWDNITPDILEETLRYNRQIWVMFYDNAVQNPDGNRPNDLRSNIVNLSNFIFKREIEVIAAPTKEKLNVLININREVAAGLMTQQKAETDNPPTNETAEQKQVEPAEQSGSTDQSA